MFITTIFILQISKENTDNPAFDFTEKFNEIVKSGASISYNFEETHSFLSKFNDSYFTYQGSLTTPPCRESVTFVVFEHFQLISRNQV